MREVDRERLPEYTWLYRDLARFDAPGMLGRLRGVSEGLVRQALAAQPWETLDCDSTLETMDGRPERARPAPHPHRRGCGSHHPWLGRERKSGLVVNSWLRPRDTHPATGAVEFVRPSVARLPPAPRRSVLIRANRGFDAEALDAAGEDRARHSLAKPRVTANLASASGRTRPRGGAGGSIPSSRRRAGLRLPRSTAELGTRPPREGDAPARAQESAGALLAFTRLVLSQRQALGWTVRHRAKTVRRRRLVAVAGQLIRTAGPRGLRLATDGTGRPDLVRVWPHLATPGA